MTRIKLISTILIVMGFIVSCSDDIFVPESNQLIATIESELSAPASNGSSKINYDNDPTNKRMKILWKDGDSIGVFGSTEGSNVPYSTQTSAITDDGQTAIFTTTKTKPKGQLVAYYPYQKNAQFIGDELNLVMPQVQIYAVDGSGLPLPPAEANFMVSKPAVDAERITFSNVFALLEININQTKDSVIKQLVFTDLSDKPVSGPFKVKWTENEADAYFPTGTNPQNDTLVLDCKNGISAPANVVQRFYMLVPAREYPKGFQIDFILENGTKTTKTIGSASGKTLVKGKLYPIGDIINESVNIEYTLNPGVFQFSKEQLNQFANFNYNATKKTLSFTAPGDITFYNGSFIILNTSNETIPYGYAGQINNITSLTNGRQLIDLIPTNEVTNLFKNLSIGSPLWNTDGSPSEGEGLALDIASYITDITTYNGTQVPFSISGSTVSMKVPLQQKGYSSSTPSYILAPTKKSVSPFSSFINKSMVTAADKYTPTFTSPAMTYTFNDEQALSATVGIQVTMNTIMSMSIVDRTLEYLHFKATPVITLTSSFTAETEKTYDKEVPLLEFHFAPIPVGPILIIPIMKLNAVADVKGKVNLTTTMEYKQEVPFGFSYVPGGFVYRNYLAKKDPNDKSEPFKFSGKLNIQGSAAVGAKIYGGFKVYGLLEATANVDSRIRVKCGVDFEATLDNTYPSNFLNGYFYDAYSSSKVETLLEPSIGVGVTSLGGVLNAKSQSEALEIQLSEHYLLPKFSNCKFKQTEKGKLEVSMVVKNRLLFGARLGLRISREYFWHDIKVDNIDLGDYSGPPNGKDSLIIKETIDIMDDDLVIGEKHDVCATITIDDKTIATPALGQFIPAWPNSITLTTSKSKGDSIQLSVGRFTTTRLWFDLNNNKIMEPDEHILYYNKLAVNSQTITVHGLIKSFYCDDQQLTAIDFDNCPLIQEITCLNDEITKLDLSSCTNLTRVNATNNKISSFVTASTTKLTQINLKDNNMSNFNLINQPELAVLELDNNNITNINVSNSPKLTSLSFLTNPTTNVNASNCVKLEKIEFNNGPLSLLNVNGCLGLSSINVKNNNLQTINYSGCKSLKTLNCENNQLQSLDLKDLIALEILNCSKNQLTQLDLSGNNLLKNVICSSNQLTSLDAQNCNKLTVLNCSNNQLTSLNLANCVILGSINLEYNQLYGSNTTTIMEALPDRSGKSRGILSFAGNSGYYSALEIANNKNWEVRDGSWTKEE